MDLMPGIKTHFHTEKVVQLASFLKWGFLELGGGLFILLILGLWIHTLDGQQTNSVA